MSPNLKERLAIVYSDIFDYPLTSREASIWKIENLHGLVTNLHEASIPIIKLDRYFCLQNRHRLIKLRREREKISQNKFGKARIISGKLSKIPTIDAILLTGSVAVGNAKRESDIDLMIITKPGTLWLTRAIVIFYLKVKKIYRSNQDSMDKICTNIYLDRDHLEIEPQNLYNAHEILQTKCLFDRGGIYGQWIEKNSWTKNYLPNAFSYYEARIKYNGEQCRLPLYVIRYTLYGLNLFSLLLQYLYMFPKITHEKIAFGSAFFHPYDLSDKITRKFWEKLKKFSKQVKV